MNEADIRSSKKNKKSGRILKKKKQGSPFMTLIITVTGFVFVVYCVSAIVTTQAEIAEKRQELDALTEQVKKLEKSNEEYQSILSEEDERAFMERYAVEALGYAYPNERRFYDTMEN